MRPLIQLLAFGVLCCACLSAESSSRAPRGSGGQGAGAAPLRGIYLPVTRSRNLAYVRRLQARAEPFGIRLYILDLQGYQGLRALINPEVVAFLRGTGARVVARMVCFEGGLNQLPPPPRHIAALKKMMQQSADAGFDEVQLDYIRFQDGPLPYTMATRRQFLAELLADLRAEADRLGLQISADVFGRVVFNEQDRIGQDLEDFGAHLHTIYPMLYPSHFYGQRERLSDPYGAVRDGTAAAQRRLQPLGVETIPYIQVFSIGLGYARMNLPEYVAAQILGAESVSARGWVAWNPNGAYEDLFRALKRVEAERTAAGEKEAAARPGG